MRKKNLLAETNECLSRHGKSWDDVKFAQAEETVFLPEEFSKVKSMMDFQYDPGYGSPEVTRSLMLVGDNWWMERDEYDGSEWWSFRTIPVMPTVSKPWPNEVKFFNTEDIPYLEEIQPSSPIPAVWEDSDYRCVYSDKPLVNEG